MMDSEIVSGQQSAWALLNKLGEGDAGEVYLVESLVGKRLAILKRTQKSAFSTDTVRQTAQIRGEERILKSLHTLFNKEPQSRLSVPDVIDQSKPGLDFSNRFFIVIEKAPGFDLNHLARVARLGLSTQDETIDGATPEERLFLRSIAANGKVPERILLRVLLDLVDMLEMIHGQAFEFEDETFQGVIWNDVKPDHLFWDPRRGMITIVDWGNAQFLSHDGASTNRQHSTFDDYRQLVDEMGRFLLNTSPDLHSKLGWPENPPSEAANTAGMLSIRENILAALQEAEAELMEVRSIEESVLTQGGSESDPLPQLSAIHQQILTYGEIPDVSGALRLASSYGVQLVLQDQLEQLNRLCTWITDRDLDISGSWRVVETMVRITSRTQGEQRRLFLEAAQAAICGDGEMALWQLATALKGHPEPNWWLEVTSLLRSLQLNIASDALRPWVAANRYLLTLQAFARRMDENATGSIGGDGFATIATDTSKIQATIRRLRDEILRNWTQLDPTPPYANLTYDDVLELLGDAVDFLPEEQQNLSWALSQPMAQIKIILDAWERKDFLTASKGLRRALLWDPERKRILQAEQAIRAAPAWLNQVHLGPNPDENFLEFITGLEFEGRELRNLVGPANWLDLILEACRKIRKGAWPADLLNQNPGLVREFPWIRKFERYDLVPRLPIEEESNLDQLDSPRGNEISGVITGKLGIERDMILVEPLDAWAPEARGSSARVYAGLLRDAQGQMNQAAIKLMRMDKVEYALPLFREEVLVLSQMKDVPGITPMIESGFIRYAESGQLPLDNNHEGARLLIGDMLRIGPESSADFLKRLDERVEVGWVPYIAMKQKDQNNNLLTLCDAGRNRGQFQPLADLMQMSIQICDILEMAHQRNIVYRDHKILHYYWEAESNGIYMIDWNVARHHSEGLRGAEIQMDLVQFGARGLHHILTGRSAPGALPLGPTRPEEIEQAAPVYHTQWTYDDQRLPQDLRDVLTRVLLGEYTSAAALREDLKHSCLKLP